MRHGVCFGPNSIWIGVEARESVRAGTVSLMKDLSNVPGKGAVPGDSGVNISVVSTVV
jgi:hypothetical protein